jgi:hypothetical protein
MPFPPELINIFCSMNWATARVSCTGAPLPMCVCSMAPTSITNWSKTVGPGDIGSMRHSIQNWRAWRRMHEDQRKVCGLIRHPSRRGSTGKRGGGNHLTRQTSCRSTLRLMVVRLLVVRRCWEVLNKTLLQLLPIPSSATARAISTTIQTARTTARLRLITE